MGTFKRLWTNLDKDEKQQLAGLMETSVNYLSQVAHGHKKPGKQFIALLEVRLGRSRQELFEERPGRNTATVENDEIVTSRLLAVQAKLGIERRVDRDLLHEAMTWYRQKQQKSACAEPDDLMHACKEALMRSSSLTREVCWLHAALAWELTR